MTLVYSSLVIAQASQMSSRKAWRSQSCLPAYHCDRDADLWDSFGVGYHQLANLLEQRVWVVSPPRERQMVRRRVEEDHD